MDINSYIKIHFNYNEKTGIITRDDRKNSNGSFDKDGYLILKIKGKQFKSHRVAWFLYYGKFPENIIDHKDRNRCNNKIDNLRDVLQSVNVKNTTKKVNKDTKVVGVYMERTRGLKKKFCVKIKKKTYRFYTVKDAIVFRKNNELQVEVLS